MGALDHHSAAAFGLAPCRQVTLVVAKNRDDSFHLMWRCWFDQSLILLSTPAVVNERSFLTPFEGRGLVIGRQDIKK